MFIRILMLAVGLLGLTMSLYDLYWVATWGTWEATFLELIVDLERASAKLSGREPSLLRVYVLWHGAWFGLILLALVPRRESRMNSTRRGPR
jgi:hypothetical protein